MQRLLVGRSSVNCSDSDIRTDSQRDKTPLRESESCYGRLVPLAKLLRLRKRHRACDASAGEGQPHVHVQFRYDGKFDDRFAARNGAEWNQALPAVVRSRQSLGGKRQREHEFGPVGFDEHGHRFGRNDSRREWRTFVRFLSECSLKLWDMYQCN